MASKIASGPVQRQLMKMGLGEDKAEIIPLLMVTGAAAAAGLWFGTKGFEEKKSQVKNEIVKQHNLEKEKLHS